MKTAATVAVLLVCVCELIVAAPVSVYLSTDPRPWMSIHDHTYLSFIPRYGISKSSIPTYNLHPGGLYSVGDPRLYHGAGARLYPRDNPWKTPAVGLSGYPKQDLLPDPQAVQGFFPTGNPWKIPDVDVGWYPRPDPRPHFEFSAGLFPREEGSGSGVGYIALFHPKGKPWSRPEVAAGFVPRGYPWPNIDTDWLPLDNPWPVPDDCEECDTEGNRDTDPDDGDESIPGGNPVSDHDVGTELKPAENPKLAPDNSFENPWPFPDDGEERDTGGNTETYPDDGDESTPGGNPVSDHDVGTELKPAENPKLAPDNSLENPWPFPDDGEECDTDGNTESIPDDGDESNPRGNPVSDHDEDTELKLADNPKLAPDNSAENPWPVPNDGAVSYSPINPDPVYSEERDPQIDVISHFGDGEERNPKEYPMDVTKRNPIKNRRSHPDEDAEWIYPPIRSYRLGGEEDDAEQQQQDVEAEEEEYYRMRGYKRAGGSRLRTIDN